MYSIEAFPWNKNFESGVPLIDEQHKRLVELLNALAGHLDYQADMPTFSQMFNEWVQYTGYHFSVEEGIWHEFFPEDDWEINHQADHSRFLDKVSTLMSEENTNPSDQMISEIIKFLTQWLTFHILDVDMRMAKVALDVKLGKPLEQAKHEAIALPLQLAECKKESKELNIAFNVLLKNQQTDKQEFQCAISDMTNMTVFPFLKKLQHLSANRHQADLLNILEANLEHLIKTYGRANTLSSAYLRLTPVEIQVASMIKQGQSTKTIGRTLNIASSTVSTHRKHIRKKLNLDGTTNLYSYLMSLTD